MAARFENGQMVFDVDPERYKRMLLAGIRSAPYAQQPNTAAEEDALVASAIAMQNQAAQEQAQAQALADQIVASQVVGNEQGLTQAMYPVMSDPYEPTGASYIPLDQLMQYGTTNDPYEYDRSLYFPADAEVLPDAAYTAPVTLADAMVGRPL